MGIEKFTGIGKMAAKLFSAAAIVVATTTGVLAAQAAAGTPAAAGAPTAKNAAPVAKKAAGADLVRSDTVRRLMTPTDYPALLSAQDGELSVAGFIKTYSDNYRTMTSLAGQYNSAAAASDAAALLARYNDLAARNKLISGSVAALWPSVFDNKSYSYNYILDKLGHRELLARFEAQAQATAALNHDQAGKFLSDPIARYRNEKALLLGYEIDLATALGLGAARDSLARAHDAFAAVNLDFRAIELRQRTFIDYDPVKLGAVPVYSVKNPIPKCTVYDKGTVYRILAGAYPMAQPTAIFKGLSPVAYIADNGRYSYYAGSYPTLKGAMEGLSTVKKAAVRGAKPEIVVWRDGALRNISAESAKAEAGGVKFNVQIAGAENLPQGVTATIASEGGGKDVTRSAAADGATIFIVGPYDTLIDATLAAEAIQAQSQELKVTVK